ncbi:putative tetratricopeptide-like helical domain superfamily [Helianthus annuus]|uniref:Tetratricopeptide-like helical domain superfamily n=2 Tax=Helianthus annuus TaxID=4232 RepID=A0A9K3IIV5_HELAN|nr:putative tetratricopeptide-like helical domain superfamily [Helianthus annuus]KAJ0540416.1 putative tetratricopeptide-like helical domain superfamily [Helianthus annuus]KAJ0555165.1 putative tetratricopeptide-like helical domain superfamily [Helianthus annuus]KAJ0720731.1 putative tetratricopeptide-like helical domain superfamily [Helianthus annuus]KAJ0723916.1 putative tetratricopeptide-like helical domain superfamily [Helianthus annuus]
MVAPIRHVRRCLSYLMINKAEEALRDAMQAQIINPEWSLAFYLQTAALLSLGILDKDAHEMLEDAIFLDSQRKIHWYA